MHVRNKVQRHTEKETHFTEQQTTHDQVIAAKWQLSYFLTLKAIDEEAGSNQGASFNIFVINRHELINFPIVFGISDDEELAVLRGILFIRKELKRRFFFAVDHKVTNHKPITLAEEANERMNEIVLEAPHPAIDVNGFRKLSLLPQGPTRRAVKDPLICSGHTSVTWLKHLLQQMSETAHVIFQLNTIV